MNQNGIDVAVTTPATTTKVPLPLADDTSKRESEVEIERLNKLLKILFIGVGGIVGLFIIGGISALILGRKKGHTRQPTRPSKT